MQKNVTEWQRPQTTRRYIHPPMSERMYTIWREGKIIFAESDLAVRGEYFNLVSAGMWFLRTEAMEQFDFRMAKNIHREDGIPVHGLCFDLGGIDFSIETFAPFTKAPRCYVEIRVKNNTDKPASETLSFMLRTGKEADLIFGAPDVYLPYAPDIAAWRDMKSTWSYSDGVYTDGERQIRAEGDIDFSFLADEGVATSRISLLPGEERSMRFAFDIGEVPAVDYAKEREATIARWGEELQKINKLPEKIASDAHKLAVVRNLTAQMLQCFTRPKGQTFALARQGGLQRQVWTYETMPVLEALSRVGDFDDYIEPIIEIYFNEFYSESGEVQPFAIPWAMATSNVIMSFAKYAMSRNDPEYFAKYADRAYSSFLWIKNMRLTEESAGDTGALAGLFPPLRSCDDELVFQNWGSTDSFNVRGLSALAEAFLYFGDARGAEIVAERDDYLELLRRIWRKHADAHPTGLLEVPFSPSLPDEVVKQKFAFSPCVPYITEGLDLPVSDAERIIETYTELGMIRGGLYDRMPDRANDGSAKYNLDETGKCIVWYVCNQEYWWFVYLYRHGFTERCAEILADNERFAMTDEYYMQERYNQRDPYFNPWSPNASANGRTVNMMLDFYRD